MLNAIMVSLFVLMWLGAMISGNRFMALNWKTRTAISLGFAALGFAWIFYAHATGP